MKILRNVLIFTVIMTLAFVISACGSEKTPDVTENTTTTATADTTTEPVVTTTEPVVTTTEAPVTTTLAPITSRTLIPPTDVVLPTPAVTYFEYQIQVPVHVEEETKLTLEFTQDDVGVGDLILVNSNHAIADEELLLEEMDTIYGNRAQIDDKGIYGLLGSDAKADKNAIDAINEMILAYRKEGGTLYPVITQAYRSVAEQEAKYREGEKTYGDDTPKYYSVPGCSDYHTGLAFTFKIQIDGASYDLGASQAAPFYNWLKDNAYKYGFIFRYPSDKEQYTGIDGTVVPYQMRYVGKAHSLFMQQYDLCFEEYIDYIRGYEYGKYHLTMYFIGTQYEIFFVKNEAEINKAEIAYDAVYEVSGNNADGYIVTIYRDLTIKEENAQ